VQRAQKHFFFFFFSKNTSNQKPQPFYKNQTIFILTADKENGKGLATLCALLADANVAAAAAGDQ
jgi:hypothetical protein